jgi:hypothetical protein
MSKVRSCGYDNANLAEERDADLADEHDDDRLSSSASSARVEWAKSPGLFSRRVARECARYSWTSPTRTAGGTLVATSVEL